MEENERYKYLIDNNCVPIGYNEVTHNYIFSETTIARLLDKINQQDEEIEDLQNDNEWLCGERQKLRKYVDGLIKENQQLKQSQKQLAIEKLKDLIEFINNGNSNYYKAPFEIKEEISDQINQLKEK